MTDPNRITFKGTAVGLICCAIIVAFLNLYMNILASRNSSSFQIDLSADGDVLAFHQFEFPGSHSGGASVANRRHRRGSRGPTNSKMDHQHSAHSCMGLCPDAGSLFTQADYVKTLIHARMKNLAKNAFRVVVDEKSDSTSKFQSWNASRFTPWENYWKSVNGWISPRRISIPNDSEQSKLIGALNAARVIRAGTPTKGTQLKSMILLDGGQWAVWKPKLLERTDVVDGGPTDGPDRHNGEIAAFYVGRLLELDRTPLVVGRVLNIRREIYDVADNPLKDTFFVNNKTNRYCFYGKCIYCSRSTPACADDQDRLEGALVLWLPPVYANLTRIRSPWARTYDTGRLAAWQTNSSFCRAVVDHEIFGKAPIFMDLMDMAVFDFLIGNADRHRLEFIHDRHIPKSISLLDNGKSFGNPTVDELSILAPVYQCCRIRRRFYQLMLQYSEINFGALLNDRYLQYDPLYPILTDSHLESMNRRLRKVLALLASCIEQYGSHVVLIDDGY